MAFPGPSDNNLGFPLMGGLAKYESIYDMRIDMEIIVKRPPDYDVKFINDVATCGIGTVVRHGQATFTTWIGSTKENTRTEEKEYRKTAVSTTLRPAVNHI